MNFDMLSYAFYSGIFVSLILIIFKPKIFKKLSFYFKPKRVFNIVTTLLNGALANFFRFTTYQVGRNALQIGPISPKQTLLTVLLAIAILIGKDHILQKIVGSLAAIMGTIILF